MTENPKTITFDQTACDALQLMQIHGFRHLPIIDDQCIVGIISLRDIHLEYYILKDQWGEAQHGYKIHK